MQGDKTHPLIFIVGTNNFIEYLQRYQILIFIYLFIYYKFYFEWMWEWYIHMSNKERQSSSP